MYAWTNLALPASVLYLYAQRATILCTLCIIYSSLYQTRPAKSQFEIPGLKIPWKLFTISVAINELAFQAIIKILITYFQLCSHSRESVLSYPWRTKWRTPRVCQDGRVSWTPEWFLWQVFTSPSGSLVTWDTGRLWTGTTPARLHSTYLNMNCKLDIFPSSSRSYKTFFLLIFFFCFHCLS